MTATGRVSVRLDGRHFRSRLEARRHGLSNERRRFGTHSSAVALERMPFKGVGRADVQRRRKLREYLPCECALRWARRRRWGVPPSPDLDASIRNKCLNYGQKHVVGEIGVGQIALRSSSTQDGGHMGLRHWLRLPLDAVVIVSDFCPGGEDQFWPLGNPIRGRCSITSVGTAEQPVPGSDRV
jgi:hypothetical protein